MTTPNWPALWEREPGLRPRHCSDPGCSMVLRPWRRKSEDRQCWWWHPLDSLEESPLERDGETVAKQHASLLESPHTAAALCRDKAVDYFLKRHLQAGFCQMDNGEFRIDILDGPTAALLYRTYAPTRDEALFNACEWEIASRSTRPTARQTV